MRSEEKEVATAQHPLFLDLLKGLVLPALPGVVLNAVNVSAKTDLLLSGVWFACLFAVRSVWIPSFTRLIYRRRWTRWLMFPIGVADQDSFRRILMASSWLWLLAGIIFIAFGAGVFPVRVQ